MIFGRKKAWTIDHSYGGLLPYGQVTETGDILDAAITEESGRSSIVTETLDEKRLRKRSHSVVYATMCIFSIGYSIVISGIFPYLKMLENDDHLSKTYLGWVVAVNPIGMIFSCPLVGWMANYFGSIRLTSYIAAVIFTFGNVLYGTLPSFVGLWPRAPFHIMRFARLLVGVSSGVVVGCRSYIASATLVKERTPAFSILSGVQAFGFLIGPVIQMVVSFIVEDELMRYQATGYICAFLGVVNFGLTTPYVFQEFDIAAKERDQIMRLKNISSNKALNLKPDVPALLGVMGGFFLGCLIYILLETLLEPLIQDQYAWCDSLSVVTVGVILSATGLIFLVMYMTVPKLAKYIDERKLLLWGGIGLSVVGLLGFQPVGSSPLKYCSRMEVSLHAMSQNESVSLSFYETQPFKDVQQIQPFHRDNKTLTHKLFEKYCNDDAECLGCPPHQIWCLSEPQIPFSQIIVAFAVVLTVYPINICMSSTLLSKMLGPTPQGAWMGGLSAMGSLARIIGPVYVSYVYTYMGTRYTFGFLALTMTFGGVVIAYFYKRLVPLSIE